MNVGASRDSRRGWRIVVVGTGGQGVVTAARSLCDTLAELGHEVTSVQLHGMAQRGGSVQSSVLIDCGISPMIGRGRADLVLGFEPVETARTLPLMGSGTVVYMNTTPVVPYVLAQRSVLDGQPAKYPDVAGLLEAVRAVTSHVFAFSATYCAVEAGSVRTLNMVMLGCLLGSGLLPCPADDFWTIATRTMPRALLEANARAFASGVKTGNRFQLAEANP